MGIVNCNECGTICQETPTRRCPGCQQRFHQDEDKVSEYLYDHPRTTLDEIHYATKARRHVIMEMIRRGRILEGAVGYYCENCKVLITKGRLCDQCSELIMTALMPGTPVRVTNNGNGGLHISDLIYKRRDDSGKGAG